MVKMFKIVVLDFFSETKFLFVTAIKIVINLQLRRSKESLLENDFFSTFLKSLNAFPKPCSKSYKINR